MPMRWLAIFLAMTLALIAQDSRELFNQGVQAYKNARYAEAADAFQKVVDLSPNDIAARLYLAQALLSQYVPNAQPTENTELAVRAKAEFQEIVRRDPTQKIAVSALASLTYQEALGITEVSQKNLKLDEAASWYRRAIAIDPRDDEAYYSLGVIVWAKWYPAWWEARATVGIRTDQPGPLPTASLRHALSEKYNRLIEVGTADFQNALKIDPEYADAMTYMGLFIRERADLRDTSEEYRRDVDQADRWVRRAKSAKRTSPRAPLFPFMPPPPPPPPPPDPRPSKRSRS